MIRVAETAGFCFGVNRAVETVYDLLKQGARVCTLGPIIHNPQLVESLSARGVRIIESPEEAQAGETVVIRSHGVPPCPRSCGRYRSRLWMQPARLCRKSTASFPRIPLPGGTFCWPATPGTPRCRAFSAAAGGRLTRSQRPKRSKKCFVRAPNWQKFLFFSASRPLLT